MTNILTEVLSRIARRKKSIAAKKPGFRKKIERSRKRNEKKVPSRDKLQNRALIKARKKLAAKLAGGKSKDQLSIAQKEKIEKRLTSPALKAKLQRAALKGISKEKKLAAEKRAARKKGNNESIIDDRVSDLIEMASFKKLSDVELLKMFDAAKKSKDKKQMKMLSAELTKRGAMNEAFTKKKKSKDDKEDSSDEKDDEEDEKDDNSKEEKSPNDDEEDDKEDDSKDKKKMKKSKKVEIKVHEGKK